MYAGAAKKNAAVRDKSVLPTGRRLRVLGSAVRSHLYASTLDMRFLICFLLLLTTVGSSLAQVTSTPTASDKLTSLTQTILATSIVLSEQDGVLRGCAFPTIVCQGGKPRTCFQELREQCGVEACIIQHEETHIKDIADAKIEVCAGRTDGQLAQTPIGSKVTLERSAIKVEQACLRALLRKSEGDCRRQISARLKRTEKFDEGCSSSAQACVSPLLPNRLVKPKEIVDLCTF